MGQTALLSFRRKACWGFFFRPEKSGGFGRVWTRELGYQRPAPRWHNSVQAFEIALLSVIILVLFLQIVWIMQLSRPNLRHTSAFSYSILYLSNRFNFSFDTQDLPFFRGCSHVITLPFSAGNCSSRKVEGNFTHKVIYRYYIHFQGLEFVWLPESVEGLAFQGWG